MTLFDKQPKALPCKEGQELERSERRFVISVNDDDEGITINNASNDVGGRQESVADAVKHEKYITLPDTLKEEVSNLSLDETETVSKEDDGTLWNDGWPKDIEEQRLQQDPSLAPQSDDQPKTREEIEGELLRLRIKLTESQTQVRALTERTWIDDTQNTVTDPPPLLWMRLVLAFVLGFLGWNPPLWLDLRVALNRNHPDSSDGSIDGTTPPTVIRRIRNNLKLVLFCCLFMVDFSDAILDFVVPTETILDVPPENESHLARWAYGLLVATSIARALGGMFVVLYDRIDDDDRELTYFVIELTIFYVEDLYSILFLCLKLANGIDRTPLESANIYVTCICGTLILLACFRNYDKLAKAFPPVMFFFVTAVNGVIFILCFITLFLMIERGYGVAFWFSEIELLIGVSYSFAVTVQLCVLYCWIRYLQRVQNEPRDLELQRVQNEPQDLEPEDEREDAVPM